MEKLALLLLPLMASVIACSQITTGKDNTSSKSDVSHSNQESKASPDQESFESSLSISHTSFSYPTSSYYSTSETSDNLNSSSQKEPEEWENYLHIDPNGEKYSGLMTDLSISNQAPTKETDGFQKGLIDENKNQGSVYLKSYEETCSLIEECIHNEKVTGTGLLFLENADKSRYLTGNYVCDYKNNIGDSKEEMGVMFSTILNCTALLQNGTTFDVTIRNSQAGMTLGYGYIYAKKGLFASYVLQDGDAILNNCYLEDAGDGQGIWYQKNLCGASYRMCYKSNENNPLKQKMEGEIRQDGSVVWDYVYCTIQARTTTNEYTLPTKEEAELIIGQVMNEYLKCLSFYDFAYTSDIALKAGFDNLSIF